MNVAAWLKTREGKITAGAGAALLVTVLALRKGAGKTTEGGGFSADALQTGPDGTLQDRLDQIGFRGGTLEEWITATTGLAGSVDRLTDLVDDRDPAKPAPKPPTAKSGVGLRRIGRVGRSYNLRQQAARFSPSQHPDAIESTLRRIIQLNPSLKGKTKVPGGFALKVPERR